MVEVQRIRLLQRNRNTNRLSTRGLVFCSTAGSSPMVVVVFEVKKSIDKLIVCTRLVHKRHGLYAVVAGTTKVVVH